MSGLGLGLSTLLPRKSSKIEVSDRSSLDALKHIISEKKRALIEVKGTSESCFHNINGSDGKIKSKNPVRDPFDKDKRKLIPRYAANNIYKKPSKGDPFEKSNKGVKERNEKDDLFAESEKKRLKLDIPLDDFEECDGFDDDKAFSTNSISAIGDNDIKNGKSEEYHHVFGHCDSRPIILSTALTKSDKPDRNDKKCVSIGLTEYENENKIWLSELDSAYIESLSRQNS